jgi:transposase
LPPLRAHITEYQCHKVACPHCGRATRAELPSAVRGSAFGPRLAGLIAYLTVGLRIPRRGVEQLLATALGIEISGGSTQKLSRRAVRRWRRPARNWNGSCPKSRC